MLYSIFLEIIHLIEQKICVLWQSLSHCASSQAVAITILPCFYQFACFRFLI